MPRNAASYADYDDYDDGYDDDYYGDGDYDQYGEYGDAPAQTQQKASKGAAAKGTQGSSMAQFMSAPTTKK
eukprot:CAMPEP_0118952606 /NCGR_PEP_ID=MMETSP1169-20130426/55170_1 /TAXON_ID=36882 /ORGANISM="Pyramimonas obovata, Strain CCMP722" /LENGTH=70 /DNA_ID=CAMNT_0006899905 /DNA_START=51 /DNA_END=260 /DNA_ORIENTATION=-